MAGIDYIGNFWSSQAPKSRSTVNGHSHNIYVSQHFDLCKARFNTLVEHFSSYLLIKSGARLCY